MQHLLNGPQYSKSVVEDALDTFENCLPLDYYEYAECIQWLQVEMLLKTCASGIQGVRKKGRRSNIQPAMNLGVSVGKQARGNLPELPNTMIMVVIAWLPNGDDIIKTPWTTPNLIYWAEALSSAYSFHSCTRRPEWAIQSTFQKPVHQWSWTNWTKSISDNTHTGKWWMTAYSARFDTTVAFEMLSSWTLDTIQKYCW